MDTLIKVEAPREAPLPWVWLKAPHEAQKINFWVKYRFLRHLNPEDKYPEMPHETILTPKNEVPCEETDARRITNMHDFAWCFEVPHIVLLTIYKRKMRCPATVPIDVASVMSCLGLASLWGNYSPNCLSLIFGKTEPHFEVCDRQTSYPGDVMQLPITVSSIQQAVCVKFTS